MKAKKLGLPIKQLIWDYNLSEGDFLAILLGKKEVGWFNQDWALLRLVENLHYYELKRLVDFKVLKQHWPHIRNKVFNKYLKEEYDWLLQEYFVSTTR